MAIYWNKSRTKQASQWKKIMGNAMKQKQKLPDRTIKSNFE